MITIQQSEPSGSLREIPFKLVDINTILPLTGASGISVRVRKTGESSYSAGAGSITELGSGVYFYEATVGEVDTPINLLCQFASSGSLVFDSWVEIQEYNQTNLGQITDSRLPAVLSSGLMASDMQAISTDTDAADNLEATYDGTGYEDDVAPAQQQQLDNIALTGAAINASSDTFVMASGTVVANTVLETVALDGVEHQIEDDGGEIDLYYEFDIGGDGVPTSVTFTGRVNSANDSLKVFSFNWNSSSWEQVGTVSGQGGSTNCSSVFMLFTSHVGAGANLGKVRFRFQNNGLTNTDFYIDQIFVSYAVVNRSVGYEGGAVWIDTINGVSGITSFIHGTADNPSLTLEDATTIASGIGLSRFRMAPGSDITLEQGYVGFEFGGNDYTIWLNGQDINHANILNAHVLGSGIAAEHIRFIDCELHNVSLPPSEYLNCFFGGVFICTASGTYLFSNCTSSIAGSGTPTFDFNTDVADTNLNFRRYSGGVRILNCGVSGIDVMSLEGFGQLIIDSSCVGGEAVIRGHFDITDEAGDVLTILQDPNYTESHLVDAAWDEALTGATHNVSSSAGRRLRQLEEGRYDLASVWIDTINGASGIVDFENGTVQNPVDNLADARTLAASLGIVRFQVAAGSSLDFVSATDGFSFYGQAWNVGLGGQSISGSCIHGAIINGVATAIISPEFENCKIGNATLPPCVIRNSAFIDELTINGSGNFFFDLCYSGIAGTNAPSVDFGMSIGTTNLNYRHYSGGIEIKNMGVSGVDNMSLEGDGQLIINANCVGGTVAIRGHFPIADNASGVVTLSDDARFTRSELVDDTWNEVLNGHLASGTTGLALFDSSTGSGVDTASDIADAVWDEVLAGHLGSGTTGKTLDDIDANVIAASGSSSGVVDAVWDALRANHTVSGSFGESVNVDASGILTDAVDEIVDGVWDENNSEHLGSGTTGLNQLKNIYTSEGN